MSAIYSPRVRESKKVSDSGFHAMDSAFKVVDSGFLFGLS